MRRRSPKTGTPLTAKQQELALTVEVVHVHDPEAGLARAAAIGGRQPHPPPGDASEHEGEEADQHENDEKGDQVLDQAAFDAELGQHGGFPVMTTPGRRAH